MFRYSPWAEAKGKDSDEAEKSKGVFVAELKEMLKDLEDDNTITDKGVIVLNKADSVTYHEPEAGKGKGKGERSFAEDH